MHEIEGRRQIGFGDLWFIQEGKFSLDEFNPGAATSFILVGGRARTMYVVAYPKELANTCKVCFQESG